MVGITFLCMILANVGSHECLQRASEKTQRHSGKSYSTRRSKEGSRIAHMLDLADIMHIHAEFLSHTQHGDEALQQILYESSLLSRVWKSVSTSRTPQVGACANEPSDAISEVDVLSDTMTKITLEQAQMSTVTVRDSAPSLDKISWEVASRLLSSFRSLASTFRRDGMFQESSYYIDQAQRLAENLKVQALLAAIQTQKGDVLNRAASLSEGAELLRMANAGFLKQSKSYDVATHHCLFGYMHKLQHQWPLELEQYEEAEKTLQTLDNTLLWRKLLVKDLSTPETTASQSLKSDKKSLATSRRHGGSTKKPIKESTVPTVSTKSLAMQLQIAYNRAFSSLARGDLKAAAEHISLTDASGQNVADSKLRIQERLIQAQIYVAQGLQQLASHAIYSMLPESTISIPSIASSTHPASPQRPSSKKRGIETKQHRKIAATSTDRSKSKEDVIDIGRSFLDAMQKMNEVLSAKASNLSLHILVECCHTFVTASMMVCSLPCAANRKASQPLTIAYALGKFTIAQRSRHMADRV